MPIIASQFRPPFLISNGHVQTILGSFLQREGLTFERERLELPDGDFLDLDWLRNGSQRRLVILSHGLESCSSAGYIVGTARAMAAKGWDALAWNMRGCSGDLNRLARSYHSGESNDLRTVIAHAAKDYDQVALVGFSLGGNVTLKYLGEAVPHPKVTSAACVSVPVDLGTAADAIDGRWQNLLYRHRFLATMVVKMRDKQKRFPEQMAPVDAAMIRTIRQYDEHYTAPLHGFADAEDYYVRSSSRQFLSRIAMPTLLLNARNDSFLTEESMPFEEARNSAVFHFEAPESGGHVGFLEHFASPRWYEKRVVEFLDQPSGGSA